MNDNPKFTFAKWILFMADELFIVFGSIYFIFKPCHAFGIVLCVLNIVTGILIFYLGRDKVFGLAIPFLIQIIFSNPIFFFVLSRLICLHLENNNLLYFSFVALILIIPVMQELLLFKQLNNISYFNLYYDNIEISNSKVVNFDYSKYHQKESSFLPMIIFSAIKLFSLGIITVASYLELNIPHLTDVYNGIIFSIAFDAFFRPLLQYFKNRIIDKEVDARINSLELQIKDMKSNLDNYFNEAKNQYEIPLAKMFMEKISKEYPELNLKILTSINNNYYIFIRNSVADFFCENPYLVKEEILIKDLYQWSKFNSLKNVPYNFNK